MLPDTVARPPVSVGGSGGIRTHASEETGALNQRLRPLGHATNTTLVIYKLVIISILVSRAPFLELRGNQQRLHFSCCDITIAYYLHHKNCLALI